MKTITFLIFLFTTGLLAQGLNQREFNIINADVKETLRTIDTSDDFLKLIEKFNLSDTDSAKLENLIRGNSIKFLKNMQSKSHILPFYNLTDDPHELKLTVFTVTVEPQRKGEEFHRGKYHFILTSIIRIKNENLIYKNSEIISQSDAINTWFLKGYQSYLDHTKMVFDKFSFTPPPPPLPPSTLK